jgi:hypothetical protein
MFSCIVEVSNQSKIKEFHYIIGNFIQTHTTILLVIILSGTTIIRPHCKDALLTGKQYQVPCNSFDFAMISYTQWAYAPSPHPQDSNRAISIVYSLLNFLCIVR